MQFKNFQMPKDRVLSTKTFLLSQLTLLILGLSFFGGLYYVLYPEKFQPSDTKYNPVTKEPVSLFLEISTPEDDTLVNDGSLVVSGKTGANSAVIISSADNNLGLQSGLDGQFSKVFPLIKGANIIDITAFDSEGNSKTITKAVYYEESNHEKE